MINTDALCFQGLGLGQRAGHAVQDEAVFAIGLGYPLRDDAENQLVGDQIARVHVGFCFLAQLGAIAMASRSIFPVEMAGIESLETSSSAWVPFPAPGAPSRMRFILPYLLLSPGSPCNAA